MSRETLSGLLDRWTNDAGFRTDVRRDAEGTVRGAGYSLGEDEWATLRAADCNASNDELRARTSMGGA